MKLLLPLASVVAGLTACSPDRPLAPASSGSDVPSSRATTLTESFVEPFAIQIFVPCANAGAGELVFFSGNLHFLGHITETENGHSVRHLLDNPQGLKGTGLVSGDTYHGTLLGVSTENDAPGEHNTFVTNWRVIGVGAAPNFLVHGVIHLTVDATGRVVVDFAHQSVECK